METIETITTQLGSMFYLVPMQEIHQEKISDARKIKIPLLCYVEYASLNNHLLYAGTGLMRHSLSSLG